VFFGAAGDHLSSGVIGGILVGGFFLLGLMLAVCRVFLRQKIQSQRLSVSTQSLIGPGQVITDGSRVNSPLTARRMSQRANSSHRNNIFSSFRLIGSCRCVSQTDESLILQFTARFVLIPVKCPCNVFDVNVNVNVNEKFI